MGNLGEGVHEYILNISFTHGPSINSITHKPPMKPLFYNHQENIYQCGDVNCTFGCECSHMINLQSGKVIQQVISNFDSTVQGLSLGHHSVHIHGHGFAVLKVTCPFINDSTNQITVANNYIDCGGMLLPVCTYSTLP